MAPDILSTIRGRLPTVTIKHQAAGATASDVTPAEAYDTLGRYMQFIIPSVMSRLLGLQIVHFNILEVQAYWASAGAHAVWGDYTITTMIDRKGKVAVPLTIIRVDNIQLGAGWPISVYFSGEITGINTVVVRYQFWKLYVISSIRENVRNRITGRTGETFVPIASRTGILSSQSLIGRIPANGKPGTEAGPAGPLGMMPQSGILANIRERLR